MGSILLGTYFLIAPNIKSAEVTLGLWFTLLFALLLVNGLLIRNYKKQSPHDGVCKMNSKKHLQNHIRGWLPKAPDVRIAAHTSMSKKRKVTIIVGTSAVLICGFFLLSVMLTMVNPIYPTDTKIIDTLNQNKDYLLGIPSVVGAGIARDESNNYIVGIAVYVADNTTGTAQIPPKIGDFSVFVQNISDVGDFEKKQMIISREDSQ